MAGYVLQSFLALNSNLSRDFFFGLNFAITAEIDPYRSTYDPVASSSLLSLPFIIHTFIPPRPMAFSSGYSVVVIAAAMTIVVVVVASSSSLVIAEEDVIHNNIMPNNAHEVRVKL